MPKYITNWNVGYAGATHATGAELDIPEDDQATADFLLERGAISPATPGKAAGKGKGKGNTETQPSEPDAGAGEPQDDTGTGGSPDSAGD